MRNHEIWQTCEQCGQEYDARLWDTCPQCGHEAVNTSKYL